MGEKKLGRFKDFEQDEFFDIQLPHEATPQCKRPSKVKADIPPDFKFNMFWMGKLCGRLAFDEKEGFWQFQGPNALDEKHKNTLPTEIREQIEAQEKVEQDEILARLTKNDSGLEGTRVPYFVESLMPESWISNSISNPLSQEEIFDPECADRYLSNIVIRPATRRTPIRIDVREGSLGDPGMIDHRHVFQGYLDDIFIPSEDEKVSFRLNKYYQFQNYAALHSSVDVPRMSGVQDKLPAFLSRHGQIQDASTNSFTHILKFPVSRNNIRRGLCSLEWFSTLLAKRCGLETENFAVTEVPGFGPVFIAERFDIRIGSDDNRAVLAEDFCSILGERRYSKDKADLVAVLFNVLDHSTAPEEDVRRLLKMAIFSWLIHNDDLHLKNMMLVKTYDEDMKETISVRLAPVYDMVCTSVYMGAKSKPTLSIMDTHDYSVQLFRDLGQCANIGPEEINEMTRELVDGIIEHSQAIIQDLPDFILNHPHSLSDIDDMINCVLAPDGRLARTVNEIGKKRPRPVGPS